VPTLLLHGTADGLVPVAQAHRLAAHRASYGLPTQLSIYEGAPHGFFNQPGAHADRGVKEILEHVLAR
jgi:pimeloyl-ACP methyl ester carboxylesterase